MGRQEVEELADGLANAARVAWRWLKDDESPWDRQVTLRMVEGLSSLSSDLRADLDKAKQEGGEHG